MTAGDFAALSPLLVVAATIVVVMLAISIRRDPRWAAALTAAGFVLATLSILLSAGSLPRRVTDLVVVDGYGAFFIGLILAAGVFVAVLGYGFFEGTMIQREEFYLLLGLGTLGACTLAVSDHFVSFFLGLEVLSVSLYAMIAYPRLDRRRIEAGLKYLILAGAAGAFLLFGMSLIYAQAGSMVFGEIVRLSSITGSPDFFTLTGLGLLIVGVGFKLAVVPFHMWTPDVYQGAPPMVTGYIATVSKGAVFALMLRYFIGIEFYALDNLTVAFSVIAAASMLGGNLIAVMQEDVKRLLAYSSIAHLGYLLVAFIAASSAGQSAVAFYFVAYFATTLLAFGVLSALSTRMQELEELQDYRGLFHRDPGLALLLTIAVLSLAGLPPTAGLVGKIYLALAGVESSLWALLIVLVLGSVIGVYYYMRLVVTLFREPLAKTELPIAPAARFSLSRLALYALGLVVLALGVYPFPLLRLIENVVLRFG